MKLTEKEFLEKLENECLARGESSSIFNNETRVYTSNIALENYVLSVNYAKSNGKSTSTTITQVFPTKEDNIIYQAKYKRGKNYSVEGDFGEWYNELENFLLKRGALVLVDERVKLEEHIEDKNEKQTSSLTGPERARFH